jgi:hypothetical protein
MAADLYFVQFLVLLSMVPYYILMADFFIR